MKTIYFKPTILYLFCFSVLSYPHQSHSVEDYKIKDCGKKIVKFLDTFKKDGVLIRNLLSSTIPYFRTSFKDEVKWIRIPIKATDVNNDFQYELLYVFDITKPQHSETKIYSLLTEINIKYMDSLISDKAKSPYFSELMKYLNDRFSWNATRDLIGGDYIELLSDKYLRKLITDGGVFRKTLFQFNGGVYILIEDITQKKAYAIKIFSTIEQKYGLVCRVSS